MGSAAPASCFLPGLHTLASPSDNLQAGSLSKSFLLQVFVVMVFIETQLREYSTMLWQHDPFKNLHFSWFKNALLAFGVPCNTSSMGQRLWLLPAWHSPSPDPLRLPFSSSLANFFFSFLLCRSAVFGSVIQA